MSYDTPTFASKSPLSDNVEKKEVATCVCFVFRVHDTVAVAVWWFRLNMSKGLRLEEVISRVSTKAGARCVRCFT